MHIRFAVKVGIAVVSLATLLAGNLLSQEVKSDKAKYTVEAFPKKGLPGINMYLVVGVEGEALDKSEHGFYRLAESSDQRVTIYKDFRTKEEFASYKTGGHLQEICRLAQGEPRVTNDQICILVNAEPSSYAKAFPLALKLVAGRERKPVIIKQTIVFDKLTIEEKADHAFLKQQELLGTFRIYPTYHPDLYTHTFIKAPRYQHLLTPGRFDSYANAIPEEVIDSNPTLDTMEAIFAQIKKRDTKRSRYIAYLQAKLIYDLGLYQTKLEKSTPTEVAKLTPLPDALRNDILRYLETELTKDPSPLLQYHYAIFVADDEVRSLELLQEVYKKTNDSQLQKLAERGIALIERRKALKEEKLP